VAAGRLSGEPPGRFGRGEPALARLTARRWRADAPDRRTQRRGLSVAAYAGAPQASQPAGPPTGHPRPCVQSHRTSTPIPASCVIREPPADCGRRCSSRHDQPETHRRCAEPASSGWAKRRASHQRRDHRPGLAAHDRTHNAPYRSRHRWVPENSPRMLSGTRLHRRQRLLCASVLSRPNSQQATTVLLSRAEQQPRIDTYNCVGRADGRRPAGLDVDAEDTLEALRPGQRPLAQINPATQSRHTVMNDTSPPTSVAPP
jgi:hypothetical protein